MQSGDSLNFANRKGGEGETTRGGQNILFRLLDSQNPVLFCPKGTIPPPPTYPPFISLPLSGGVSHFLLLSLPLEGEWEMDRVRDLEETIMDQ